MSNPITEARADVKAAVAAIQGVQVFDYIPERLQAPAAIVMPGSPYVVPGKVLGEFSVTLVIRVYTDRGTNEVVTKALDDLIVNVCNSLVDFGVIVVAEPGVDPDYDKRFLATEITINTTYKNGGN